MLFLFYVFLLENILQTSPVIASVSVTRKIGIGFVIFSQANDYHYNLALQKESDILKQAKKLDLATVKVFKSHESFGNVIGHWTVFPLFEKLSALSEFSWIFFLDDMTNINLKLVMEMISQYDSSAELFVGYALKDEEATIIHHFASADANSLLYPYFSTGFFMSLSLIQKSASRLPLSDDYAFSIDPQYELAKFIWNDGVGTKLIHECRLCVAKVEGCASWIENRFENCDSSVSATNIYIGMKTCYKFHNDRVIVVQDTWASDVKNLTIFSDKENLSIPTIKVDIENVHHGHCEKTLFIMNYYLKNNIPVKWLVIVDDDTLLNFKMLQKVLSCYNPSDTVAVGERYGYGVVNGLGYDYITGGGGMAFSMPTLEKLVQNCQCPSIDSPDDMIIGMCLKKLRIPVTHLPHFHQARPNDYPTDFLEPLTPVSFHKHWMIDPYIVYEEWILKNDETSHEHSEL